MRCIAPTTSPLSRPARTEVRIYYWNMHHCLDGQDTTFCIQQPESVARLGAFLFSRAKWRVRISARMVCCHPVRIPKSAAIISPACPNIFAGAIIFNPSQPGFIVRGVAAGFGTMNDNHPREVFSVAVAMKAAFIVMVHNHPSGDPTPSEADIKVTRDLIRAGNMMKIELTDHVIMGNGKYSSLRELGYFYR